MRQRNVSSGASTVMVVGVDQRGMGLIRECLGTEAVLPAAPTPYAQAIDEIRKARPNTVVTGFDGDFDEAVRLGPQIHQEIGANITLIAIAAKADPNHIRAAMRSGYREYVVLPEDGALLRHAVRESGHVATRREDQGELISVLGTKGGAGISLLTVNLAAELSAVHRVCVIDLNFHMGDAASILDLSPKSSIVDIIQNLDRLDERMLAGTVAVHPSKVHVISQPNELQDAVEVREDEMLKVLTVTADVYQYVLVDCGMRIDQATLTTTAVSDLILVVCEPSVLSVKNTFRRLQLLTRLGIEKDVIRLVVNKYNPRTSPVSIKDIEKNLNAKVACTIARDDAVCQRALDQGVLIRDVDKKSAVAKDLSAAVGLITDKAVNVEREETPSLLGKIFK
jgi:pilus assembly protein CpaE